jgi:hypothetical protein
MTGGKHMAAMLAGAMLASLACAAQQRGRMVDPALHRQWLIERNLAHPERPARLVEVPWTGGAVSPRAGAQGSMRQRLVVRAGMKVTLTWRDGDADLRLTGTALSSGHVGDVIWVRAGLHSAILRGVVRGPGVAEMERGGR